MTPRNLCDRCGAPSTVFITNGKFYSCTKCLPFFVAEFDEIPVEQARAAIQRSGIEEFLDDLDDQPLD